MFISSQSKLSMESKKFLNKSYQANWPKGGYGIKSQKYAVILSQFFISSQSKLSIESKKFFHKTFRAHQPKWGYRIDRKMMQSFCHKCSFGHNLKLT